MQIIRTVVWVVLAIALLIFSYNNWTPVEVKIWEDLILETKKPVLVILSFLAGFLPIFLLHRGTRWQMTRRIKSLETAVRDAIAAATPPAVPTPEPAPAPEPAAEPVQEPPVPVTEPVIEEVPQPTKPDEVK